MRRIVMLLFVLLLSISLAGCSGISEKVKMGVVAIDEIASDNEAVVEKLCTNPEAVTEDEKVTAIRNARIIHIGTKELRRLVVGE